MPSQFSKLRKERFENSGTEFSSDGFREEFQDFSGSSIQARHYAGGFYAGFTLGQTLGGKGADLREDKDRLLVVPNPGSIFPPVIITTLPENASQKANKALSAVAAKHGAMLDNRNTKIFDIPRLIRKEVCQ